MKCPVCGSNNDKVLETRTTSSDSAIRRRRVCLDCGFRFTSYERVEYKPITVIKKNGDIQNFDPQKIVHSIQACTDKRNISQDKIDDLVQNVEEAIRMQAGSSHEITSSAIGEEILRQLYKVDAVAYVRFASVYRGFNTVQQFINEIENLTKEN